MAEIALEQFQRLLRIIPLLADGEVHSYAQIAERAGVAVKTVVDDLRAVAERYDTPGGFVESLQVFLDDKSASLNSGPFLRPMRLTGRELAALELGLAILRVETPSEERPVIDRARARIRGVILKLPAADGLSPTAAETGPEVDLTCLSDLRRAVTEQRTTRITYQGSGRKKPDERTVCPYAVLQNSGMWYLVAHCKEASGLRIFRFDRITAHKLTASTFTVPKAFSLDAVIRDGRVFMAKDAITARIRYSPKIARWIAEREGRPTDADGSLTLEHPMADTSWAIRHVLQYGPDAEVLEPAELRTAVQERLTAMLK